MAEKTIYYRRCCHHLARGSKNLELSRVYDRLSIFIGSEDTRKQLPEDSLRFDGIDADFKTIMAEAANVPNVVKATNKPGLFEALESMQDRLTLCEKSLAEYLETKVRQIFITFLIHF